MPSGTGGFVPFDPGPRERAEIAKALDGDGVSVAVFCWPRRHGKTLTSAMVLVWRFLTRAGENIAVVANSEKQVVDTAFRTIRQAFEQTPLLKRLVAAGTVKVLGDRIELPSTGSLIQAFSSNPSALWGKKLSAAQISEIHAAKNGGDEVFEALAGSLLDTAGSLLLIDSTVASKSSKLWELYQAATHADDPDTSIAFSHIQYADLDEACDKSPAWIAPAKLRSLARQMLPHKFALLHLNRWGDAANLLFPAAVLDPCLESYPLDLDALAAGSASIVGGGLDRAFGGTVRGDKTATACVAKIALDDEEHIYVLDADSVPFSRMAGIKTRLDGYHTGYAMKRLVLESYGAQDVADWAGTRPYSAGTEVVHPSRRTKYVAFLALYQAAAEGRLHIHPRFKELIAELRAFEVHEDGKATDGEAAVPKFSHPRGGHDDFVHALAWAVYSLRTATLNPYEIAGINCTGIGASIVHCALNGGDHVPACADVCRSMSEARELYQAYLARGPLVPLQLPAFIANKLQNIGAHTLPR
ncbi:MAG TPA: terminase large subunit [Sphingomonas sp.]|nr:terminase large subunit [Sphingomonas sp.]